MSDVEIIFPTGREVLAERLREAIDRAGYSVDSPAGVAPGAMPPVGDAIAILIVWDRSSIGQPGLQQAAAAARRRGRALDISADGITPVDIPDENRLIHLSGWRGEPTHPGWKKILAELERLCGGHRIAAAAARQVTSKVAAASGASSPGRWAALMENKAKLAVICLGVVLIVALVGFFAMSGRSLNLDRSPRESGPIPAAQPMATPHSGTAATDVPINSPPVTGAPVENVQPSNLQSAGNAESEAAATPAGTASPASAATVQPQPPAISRPSTASQSKAARRRATGVRTAHEQPRGTLRYTKYSKTMRLFCQRSGHGTPQCRLFDRTLEATGEQP